MSEKSPTPDELRVLAFGLEDNANEAAGAMIRSTAKELARLQAENAALRDAYHQLWRKHGHLAEKTVDEVVERKP